MTITRIDVGPRLSEATILANRIYLSGMIPEDTSLDIAGQVRQALAEIDALLAKGGSDKTKIETLLTATPDQIKLDEEKIHSTIVVFGGKVTGWQVLPADDDAFENRLAGNRSLEYCDAKSVVYLQQPARSSPAPILSRHWSG